MHHYEIGPEVAEQVRDTFGIDAGALLVPSNGDEQRVQFDLWAANRLILEQSGLRQIEVAGLCTAVTWMTGILTGGRQDRPGGLG